MMWKILNAVYKLFTKYWNCVFIYKYAPLFKNTTLPFDFNYLCIFVFQVF